MSSSKRGSGSGWGPPTSVDQNTFMDAVTAGGTRGFRDATGVQFRDISTHSSDTQSMSVRHRSGSVTELHMHGDAVGSAYHRSVTTGQHLQLRPIDMTGAQKRDNHAHTFKEYGK